MKKEITLLFALLLSVVAMAEMSLVVSPMFDTDKITALQKIGKLVYSGDSLLVYDNAGMRVYGDLFENVKHVRYSDEEPQTPVETQYIASQILVYPNPTADVLYIDNAEVGEVRLYTSDGRLMQVVDAGEGRVEFNMSGCPAGVYVLVANNQVFNVIKR